MYNVIQSYIGDYIDIATGSSSLFICTTIYFIIESIYIYNCYIYTYISLCLCKWVTENVWNWVNLTIKSEFRSSGCKCMDGMHDDKEARSCR